MQPGERVVKCEINLLFLFFVKIDQLFLIFNLPYYSTCCIFLAANLFLMQFMRMFTTKFWFVFISWIDSPMIMVTRTETHITIQLTQNSHTQLVLLELITITFSVSLLLLEKFSMPSSPSPPTSTRPIEKPPRMLV